MRRYLTLFLVLVTLAIAGCASDTSEPKQSPWRTPSGGEISDRVPEFSPLDSSDQAMQQSTSTPMATNQSGRASSTPYYTAPSGQQELPPIKVGFLVPLSGPQAALGQAMMNAAQLALFDIEASNVTLIPQDTHTGAARAAQNALADGAQIILGPLFAQDVKAVTPVADARNVPVVAFSTDWTAASTNTYIMGFMPFGQVSRVVDFAAKRGARNFKALVPETAYGMAVNSTFKNALQRHNGTVPQSIIFPQSNGLPRAIIQLTQTQQAGSMDSTDALLLPIGGAQLAQAATLLRQNDLSMRQTRILGTGLWDESSQASALVPGGWYAAPDPKLRNSFNRQYAETYGQNPPRLASLAYDATALAATLAMKGLRETGTPAFSRSDFTNPSGFAGIDGVFRFRSDNLAERGLAILELRNTGPVVVDPAPTHF